MAAAPGSNLLGGGGGSELAAVPVSTGLTHEFAHVFRSVRSVTATTSTTTDSSSGSSQKAGERVPRFV